MADLPRIHFDTNNEWEKDTYPLKLSIEDIQRLGDSLHVGTRVLLYMTDELEVEATLEYNEKYKAWVGRADWVTIRYLQ